jgi:membrane-associated phospholipid phosphatase
MAAGCAFSRIYFDKHFPSDLYAGLLIGACFMLWLWRLAGPRLGLDPNGLPTSQPSPQPPDGDPGQGPDTHAP